MVLSMQNGINILVVGGTGVISYALVNEALKQGIHVTCINRGHFHNQLLPNNVEIIKADYKNRELIENKLNNRYFDVVIDVLCYDEKDIDYSVSLFKGKCEQYIFLSSCAVYNKGDGSYECSENSELINPVWKYSIDKVKCEKKLIELSAKCGLNYTIVRPAVTYGNTRVPYGITPPYGYHGTLIMRILNHKPIILWDGGQAYSTITRVEDFAVGLVGLLGNKKAYNEIYHIAGDERCKWKDVIDTLGDILGVTPIYFSITKEEYADEIPEKKGEILGGRGISQLLNNSKIKALVPEFGTHIPLKEGLRMTIEYYKQHNYLSGIDYKFDADTDRIIMKYCKLMQIDERQYNLRFVDYLGNATLKEKLIYWMYFHKNFIIVKKMILLKKILTRLSR